MKYKSFTSTLSEQAPSQRRLQFKPSKPREAMRIAYRCTICARQDARHQASLSMKLRCRRRTFATNASTSTAIEVTDPLLLYENLVRSGRVQWDEEQVRILVQLKRIHQSLVDYRPSHSLRYLLEKPAREATSSASEDGRIGLVLPSLRSEKSLVRALTHEDDLSTIDSPAGFMLTGSVGTGKTLLLDLFYQSLPVSKQRIHYHAFLLGLYRKVFLALEQQRTQLDEEENSMQKMASMDRKGPSYSRKDENKAKALTRGWRQVGMQCIFMSLISISKLAGLCWWPQLRRSYLSERVCVGKNCFRSRQGCYRLGI